MEKKKITLVVPCKNEEEVLPVFYKRICEEKAATLDAVSETSILFIDDGSDDGTLAHMKRLAAQDKSVHYISFSRNFGKEAAIYAGLLNANSDYVAVMDVDLQDPPELLIKMFEVLESGEADLVGSRRVTRKGEPPIRSFFARLFYKLMNKISETEVVDGARDYQMMNKKVVRAILSMGEYNRFSKGITGWVGYKKKWLEYENEKRAAGETSWSFKKLVIYALEGIVAFSTVPLVISSVIGIVFCLLAFIAIVFIIVRTLIFGDPTSGWPSLVCIIMLVSGVQLMGIGILGQYLAKTYLETKNRPKYLVDETDLEAPDGKDI